MNDWDEYEWDPKTGIAAFRRLSEGDGVLQETLVPQNRWHVAPTCRVTAIDVQAGTVTMAAHRSREQRIR